MEDIEDERIWSPADNGLMSLKAAYTFHAPEGQHTNWGKIIWNSAVPPSKSLLIWRMLFLEVFASHLSVTYVSSNLNPQSTCSLNAPLQSIYGAGFPLSLTQMLPLPQVMIYLT